MKNYMKRIFLAVIFFIAIAISSTAQSTSALISQAKSMGFSEEDIRREAQKYLGGAAPAQTEGSTYDHAIPATAYTGRTNILNDERDSLATRIALLEYLQDLERRDTSNVFGHALFYNRNLDFSNSYNIPTPANYALCPQDEVIIDVWGDAVFNFKGVISPEGSVTLPNLGPVYLAGRKMDAAQRLLEQKFAAIYPGFKSDNPTTFLRISLGRIRSLKVNVVGDVNKPGSYDLPSLAPVFAALAKSGGPTAIAGVRDIKIYRAGKLFKEVDVYAFLFGKDNDSNLRLQDNDLIVVNPPKVRIEVAGEVRRPMLFDMLENETMEDVLTYAAGFTAQAYRASVTLTRFADGSVKTYNVIPSQFNTFKIKDGDKITIQRWMANDESIVSVLGAVKVPGSYAISADLKTARQLVDLAGGLLPNASTQHAYIERYDKNRQPININFSLEDLMDGKISIALEPEDVLHVISLDSLREDYTVKINGRIHNENTYPFREGMTLHDLVYMAGGFSDGASLTNIDIARRIFDPQTGDSEEIAEIITCDITGNPESYDTPLQPYDIVMVRNLPNYKEQKTIHVKGEVAYEGYYVISTPTVLLSEVIAKAGGTLRTAYLAGAFVERLIKEEEMAKFERIKQIAEKSEVIDTNFVKSLSSLETYKIAVDLKDALNNPGSAKDLVLNDGDVVYVPMINNIVTIRGCVYSSNTVIYDDAASLRDYINQAGGYTQHARRCKVYVIQANGKITTRASKGGIKITPGCEIVVPQKEKRRDISPAEVITTSTGISSFATTILSLVNLISRL